MDFMSTAQLLGNLGEFAAAIGVVATLAYLGVQVRQSARATRAGVRADVTRSIIELTRMPLEDRSLSALMFKVEDREEISRDERWEIYWYIGCWWRTFENIHYQYANGLLDDREWSGHLGTIKSNLTGDREMGKLIELVFDREKPSYSPDFAALIENLRKSSTTRPA